VNVVARKTYTAKNEAKQLQQSHVEEDFTEEIMKGTLTPADLASPMRG